MEGAGLDLGSHFRLCPPLPCDLGNALTSLSLEYDSVFLPEPSNDPHIAPGTSTQDTSAPLDQSILPPEWIHSLTHSTTGQVTSLAGERGCFQRPQEPPLLGAPGQCYPETLGQR